MPTAVDPDRDFLGPCMPGKSPFFTDMLGTQAGNQWLIYKIMFVFFFGGGWTWPELQRWSFVAQILSMDHGRTSEQTAKIDEGPKDRQGVYMGRLVLVNKN